MSMVAVRQGIAAGGEVMGALYRRRRIWWIKYYRNGKPYRESSRSHRETEARRLLKLREGKIAEGRLPGIKMEKVSLDELVEDFLNDYQLNKRKSLDKAKRNVRHLRKSFAACRVMEITSETIRAHIIRRQEEGASNAGINRELAALKRMLRLGAQATPPKVIHFPYIPMLKENNVRKGFFEYEEFVALKNASRDHMKPVITFAYYTGWGKGETLNLRWENVALSEKVIVLDPGTTKNDQPRSLYLDGKLYERMTLHKLRRDILYPECPRVFFQDSGKAIRDFRGA